MTDDQALHLVRNPWGHAESEVREARLYLCDRFEQVKREANVAIEHKFELSIDLDKVENERDIAQRIAHLALDVEDWLFRTVDALTEDPNNSLPERTQSALMGVYNDMQNARENRKKGDSS